MSGISRIKSDGETNIAAIGQSREKLTVAACAVVIGDVYVAPAQIGARDVFDLTDGSIGRATPKVTF